MAWASVWDANLEICSWHVLLGGDPDEDQGHTGRTTPLGWTWDHLGVPPDEERK